MIVSLSSGLIVCTTHFISTGSKHFNMSSKKKEYKADNHAKKAALFSLTCDTNHVTRLSIPAAIRAKEYSGVEALDGTLQMQVCRESPKKQSQKYSLSRVSGRIVATDPGNGGKDGEAGILDD